MEEESEFVLVGSGTATLMAASFLLNQGRSVTLLNPDWDFFREACELPIDPTLTMGDVRNQEDAFSVISPLFPSAMGRWPVSPTGPANLESIYASSAPFVRQRTRLWLSPLSARLNEQLILNKKIKEVSTWSAMKKCPGYAGSLFAEGFSAWETQAWIDVDVNRFRTGLFDYLFERLGKDRIWTGVSSIEFHENGRMTFLSRKKGICHLRSRSQVLFFWTPGMTNLLLTLFPELAKANLGAWQWTDCELISRDPLNDGVIASLKNHCFWAHFEGIPSSVEGPKLLRVLSQGREVSLEELRHLSNRNPFLPTENLPDISKLCFEFLNWEKFSVRSMNSLFLMDWKEYGDWDFAVKGAAVRVLGRSDGFLADVAKHVQSAIAGLL